MADKKYRVDFKGFAYVEASSPEEAVEKWSDNDHVYSETVPGEPVEVNEFIVEVP
jgi:hypothetical protein